MARVRPLALKLIVVGVVLCAAAVATHTLWLSALGRMLVCAEAPQRADAALVLAGDYFGNRILKGAELERQGYVPKVLVSGPVGLYGEYESDPAVRFAVAHGYPEQYFLKVPHRAMSTIEEAQAIVPVMRKMGIRRYLLVTSNYHTARAGRIFAARAPDMAVRVVAANDAFFAPEGWWHTREGRKRFAFEWMKTLTELVGM